MARIREVYDIVSELVIRAQNQARDKKLSFDHLAWYSKFVAEVGGR
jgi:hypothetical protein